jgi:uncharacterized protein YbaP (TraB family)
VIFQYRGIILSGVFCLAASRALAAACQGHDLFSSLRSEAPASYAAIETAATAMPIRHGKLFRLSGAGKAPSYVFATLHLSDPRITSLSPLLRAALKDSKVVALETIETGAVLRQIIQKNPAAWRWATSAAESQRADRLLNKTDFTRLETLAVRKGLPEPVASKLKPSALALMLDLPACAIGLPGKKTYVDELIAGIARESKIETVGLETIIEQLGGLDGLPRETERDLLISVLRQADHSEDVIETQIMLYKDGDIGGLLAWLRSPDPIPGVAQAQIPQAFLDRLITKRNYRMRDGALPLLRRGGAFIAVGADHLPGTEGLLALFEKEGFKVEAIE